MWMAGYQEADYAGRDDFHTGTPRQKQILYSEG